MTKFPASPVDAAIVKHHAGKYLPLLLAILLLPGLGLMGCESAAFYWQASTGHMGLMSQRQSIPALLDDETLDPQQKSRLQQAVAIRDYAAAELALPVGGSYKHLVQLDGNYVTWNVFAAEPLSMRSQQWCFPVAGCVTYRGYFKAEAAQKFALKLQDKGLDVYVGGASAYSTLGWFKDPLLSSFLRYDDARLAALLFHELAHQVVYVKDDTAFNESFASAVEELALQQWLLDGGREQDLLRWQRHNAWVETFTAWLMAHRESLELLYQSSASDSEKLALKQAYFESMKAQYPGLRDSHQGDNSYDAWMQRPLNNASLLSIGNYNDWIGSFKQLFRACGSNWPEFYEAAAQLGEQPPDSRTAALERLQQRQQVAGCDGLAQAGGSANET